MAENNELEKTLWAAADKLRSNMDAAEYKHIVLGLIFLKYISDAFNDLHAQLKAGVREFEGADPELNKQRLGELIDLIGTYHAWRNIRAGLNPTPTTTYCDIPGFCKSSTLVEVRKNNYVLIPGRYVGTEAEDDDDILFEEKMNTLTAKLTGQFAIGSELEKSISENLKGICYEF